MANQSRAAQTISYYNPGTDQHEMLEGSNGGFNANVVGETSSQYTTYTLTVAPASTAETPDLSAFYLPFSAIQADNTGGTTDTITVRVMVAKGQAMISVSGCSVNTSMDIKYKIAPSVYTAAVLAEGAPGGTVGTYLLSDMDLGTDDGLYRLVF